MAEPSGVLAAIAARKRSGLAARFDAAGLDGMRACASATRRSLYAALSRPGMGFVMEHKRASPSAGAIRRDADPARIARGYAPVADAISVLTDGPYFGGSLDDLRAVRAVYDGPVLAKDFFIDPRQVVEARIAGADAILVMLSLLDDRDARTMIAEAARLGMDSLVEVHDAGEVSRALALGARLIGINNRDLRTLAVDLSVTERLAPLIPAERIVVSESGISGREDVERLSPFADAVLVGSSLMSADDPAAAARALAVGRVKICGITNGDDLVAAAAVGASWAGLIMVPGTPRALSLDAAERLAAAATIPTVGVFRDADPDRVTMTARRLGLAAVQLHGSEDEAAIRGLRRDLPDGVEIWGAVAVGAGAIGGTREGTDRALFDTQDCQTSGGTGRSFAWSRLAGRDDLGRAFLAGGIGPDNAAAAAKVGAFAIDVGSGIEAAPGRKDSARLVSLMAALRPLSRREARRCA